MSVWKASILSEQHRTRDRRCGLRTSGENLFEFLFFSIAPNYLIFGAFGKPGTVQIGLTLSDVSKNYDVGRHYLQKIWNDFLI